MRLTLVYTISACMVSINKINEIIFQTVFIEELKMHSKNNSMQKI